MIFRASRYSKSALVTDESWMKVGWKLDESWMKVGWKLDEGWMKVGWKLDETSNTAYCSSTNGYNCVLFYSYSTVIAEFPPKWYFLLGTLCTDAASHDTSRVSSTGMRVSFPPWVEKIVEIIHRISTISTRDWLTRIPTRRKQEKIRTIFSHIFWSHLAEVINIRIHNFRSWNFQICWCII